MTDPVTEAIRHRHPKEWVFFWLIALLTVAVLLILLLLAIFRTDVIESLQTDYIEDYRAQNPDAANLTDEEILPLLPADEKETLDWVSRLYVPVVVIVPVVLLLWFVFLTGRLYGQQRAGPCVLRPSSFLKSMKCGRAWPLPRD